jgi:hypothetical protein
MRIIDFVITVAVGAGLSGNALAQTPSSTQPVNTGTETTDHWFVSGYLGSNFGAGGSTAFQNLNVNTGTNIEIDRGSTASVNFGGEVGYVFGGWIGAEFMVNYAPNFELSDVFLQRRPNVSTYMGNVLAVVPIGGEHRFTPFVSGGIGGVRLGSTLFTIDPSATTVNINTIDTTTVNKTQFGWNLGGGLFAFNGPWGLRGDVRYYRATTSDDNPTDVTIRGVFFQRQLSGLRFWNANFGLAFRW